MNQDAQIVSKFAISLDQEDYKTTLECLDSECIYDSPTGELVGPAAIIASYKGNGDQAHDRFDSITYDHSITHLSDGWLKIAFSDELEAGGRMHTFRCNQRIQVAANKIVRIVHEEIPGQRDRLNTFLNHLK